MSKIRDPRYDQPLPKPGGESVTDAVISDLHARREMGREKYGDELRTNNGHAAGRDLYEELIDAVLYAKQVKMESDAAGERAKTCTVGPTQLAVAPISIEHYRCYEDYIALHDMLRRHEMLCAGAFWTEDRMKTQADIREAILAVFQRVARAEADLKALREAASRPVIATWDDLRTAIFNGYDGGPK